VLPQQEREQAQLLLEPWGLQLMLPQQAQQKPMVTYCMNLLQSLDSSQPFCVSLNSSHRIDPARVLRRMRYEHPVYDHASVSARARKNEIQGRRHTWYAGAYWGFGFHEDGLRSAIEVAHAFGMHWPLQAVPAVGRPASAEPQTRGDAQRVSAS